MNSLFSFNTEAHGTAGFHENVGGYVIDIAYSPAHIYPDTLINFEIELFMRDTKLPATYDNVLVTLKKVGEKNPSLIVPVGNTIGGENSFSYMFLSAGEYLMQFEFKDNANSLANITKQISVSKNQDSTSVLRNTSGEFIWWFGFLGVFADNTLSRALRPRMPYLFAAAPYRHLFGRGLNQLLPFALRFRARL